MCNTPRKMPNNKGFTLIELLIALALLVVLTGALYGTYFSVMSARDRGGMKMDQRRELSATLGKLHDELASVHFATSLDPEKQRLHFVVEDMDRFGKPTSLLQFTAIAPPRIDPAPASDLMVVRYSVQEKDEEETLSLVRESRDLFLDVGVKSAPYPLMDRIDGFSVECWDGNQWVKTWDTALRPYLPRQVRVTVTTRDGEVFSTIGSPHHGVNR